MERDVNAGDNSWQSSFTETSVTSRQGFTTRQFELVIRNRASSPQKFKATIRYVGDNRLELRTKSTSEIVIPPYEETKVEDKVAMPDRVSARVKDILAEVEVVPWEEEGEDE